MSSALSNSRPGVSNSLETQTGRLDAEQSQAVGSSMCEHYLTLFPGARKLAQHACKFRGKRHCKQEHWTAKDNYFASVRESFFKQWGDLNSAIFYGADRTASDEYKPIPLEHRLCFEANRCVCARPGIIVTCERLFAAVKCEYPKTGGRRNKLANGDIVLALLGRASWAPEPCGTIISMRFVHISDACFSPFGLEFLELKPQLGFREVLDAFAFRGITGLELDLIAGDHATVWMHSLDVAMNHWDLAESLQNNLQWGVVSLQVVHNRRILASFRPDQVEVEIASQKVFPLFKVSKPPKPRDDSGLMQWAKAVGKAAPKPEKTTALSGGGVHGVSKSITGIEGADESSDNSSSSSSSQSRGFSSILHSTNLFSSAGSQIS